MDNKGTIIRAGPNFDKDLKELYSTQLMQLIARARSVVRDLNPENDLTFLRMRTKLHEILIAPGWLLKG